MFELHKEGRRRRLGQGWPQAERERKVRSRLGTRREGEGRLGQGWTQGERERKVRSRLGISREGEES